jgi:hypothetical protein
MRGEPEPGSVIESRMAIEERVALGRVERKCAGCGRDWDGDVPRGAVMTLGRRGGVCSHCGSAEFSERDRRPTLMEITGAGITKVLEPPKVKVAATADDLTILRAVVLVLLDAESCLLAADTTLHHLVTVDDENPALFGFLQGAVHYLTDGTIGDFYLGSRGQSLPGPIRALAAELDRVLTRYDQERPKAKFAATADDLSVLSSLRSALLDVASPLFAADECLHRVVNLSEANYALFGFLQQGLHTLTDGTIGDFDLHLIGQVTGLSLLGPMGALRAEIDRVLAGYEEERNKK